MRQEYLSIVGALLVLVLPLVTFAQEPPPPEKQTPKPPPPAPCLDLYGDRLPDGAVARLGTVRLRHGGWVRSLVFSPDGSTLASVGSDRLVRVWDARTGGERSRILAAGASSNLVFCLNGSAVALGVGRDLRVWDVSTGETVFDHRPGVALDRMVESLASSGDGRVLAAAASGNHGQSHTICILDVAARSELATIELGEEVPVRPCIAVSADGKVLAWSAYVQDGKNSRTRIHLREISSAKESGFDIPEWLITALAFSPDGSTLAVGGGGCCPEHRPRIKVYRADGGELAGSYAARGSRAVRQLVFSPDGKTIAYRLEHDGVVRVCGAVTGEQTRTLEGIHFAWAPDGQTLAVARGGAIRLWDVGTGKRRVPARGHEGGVVSVAFSPDGRLLASAGGGGLRLWAVETGREIERLQGGGWPARVVVFTPDGGHLVAAGGGRETRTWDVTTGTLVRKGSGPRLWGRSLALSPDGKLVASNGKELFLAEVAGLRELLHVPLRYVGADKGTSVACSPSGDLVATGSTDVRLWEAATGEWHAVSRQERDGLHSVAFSPDARLLAAGASGGPVRVVEVATGRQIHELSEHRMGFIQITFSPDGRTLAGINSKLGRVHVWDVETGEERARFEGYQGVATSEDEIRWDAPWGLPASIAFSPDGRTLATGGSNSTVLLWRLPTWRESARRNAGGLKPDSLDALWEDLEGEDAQKAYRAILGLSREGAEAISFLRNRLHPIPEQAGEEPEGLQKASRMPVRLGPGPTLRRVRAVWALERIATDDALDLLRTLATGSHHALQTREAKAALERMEGGERSRRGRREK